MQLIAGLLLHGVRDSLIVNRRQKKREREYLSDLQEMPKALQYNR